MGSVVISGATSGAVTLAVPDEAGTRTLTLPATTGTILTNDISQAGDTSAGNAAAIGYTSAEGLILTGQGSTNDVTIKNDADTSVLVIPTGTTTLTAAGQVNVGAGLIAQTDSSVGAATANSGSGRYFDIYNTGADAATFAILRLITQQAGSSSTTSADFSKYKNGALLINNNDTHANVYTALGLGGSERMRISSAGNIAIGTTGTGDNKLTVEGGVAATNGSSLALKSGGGANSRVADLAFYGTFVTPDSDTGQRRTADITSGFSTANWGNEYLAFGVGTGGANDSSAVTTERMRITGGGKVGIGTTTPASYTSDTLVISSGDQGGMTLVSANNVENYISWADGTSGAAQLQAGYIGYNHSSNYMRFGTVATERMRIESNGNVLVGTTAAYSDGAIGNGIFQLDGRNGARIGMTCRAKNSDGSAFVTAATGVIGFVNGNGAVGNIAIDGSATIYSTSSDYRLKENVNYTFDATTRLKQLKPARFNFKADADKTVDGFLAHEVSSIVPEAITGTKDAVADNGDPIHQCIDQSKLVPLLVKTIQELEARITALEAG